jgi:ERCC4-related helicase
VSELLISPGQVVQVRSRRYLVENVEPASHPAWEQTLVDLSCLEDDAQGERLSVLWEREVDAQILQQANWEHLAKKGFDAPHIFSAYLHALRWNLVTSTNPRLFQAPHRAGIQIMSYQLEPLKRALQMPRVNLFIADDVGLGKTIEAGLILREMIMRQKVKRIVIATPASLLMQWQTEMETRFGLTFVIFDREYLFNCRRERGYAINPWTTHSRFIVSQALLRDEQYATPLRDWLADHGPGSMLILDEAHHAAPASSSSYAVDSQFTHKMRELAPLFEHRLFLSATPHNGHSNSFSALLEMLDPQRFFRGEKVTNPKLLDQVMVRRLKDELRELVPGLGLPKREVVQHDIKGLPLDSPELTLMQLLNDYRDLREQRLESSVWSQKAASGLVITTLQKRLISSIEAFSSTLRVHRKGLTQVPQPVEIEAREPVSAPKPIHQELMASMMAKSLDWFKKNADLADLDTPDADDDRAELSDEEVATGQEDAFATATRRSRGARQVPSDESDLLEQMTEIASQARRLADPRLTQVLIPWIRQHLFNADGFWNSRRVLIFTEFTETKTYLRQQLESAFAATDRAEERIATYQGGGRLEEIKEAFNASPDLHPLRILIATDAAREGVNFQNYCSDLFHFDVPWNPSRMEQRNGRIDRKLQRAPIVHCHYFVYSQRPEDHVIRTLVRKTETIRKELGSLSPVLERRIEDMFAGGIRPGVAKALEELDPVTQDRKTIEQELETIRKRKAELAIEIQSLEDDLDESQRFVGLTQPDFINAISTALELNQCPPLQGGPDRWEFPEIHGRTWFRAMDALRAPKPKDENFSEWRASSPIRPVVFQSPEHLDDDVVHLHLEHRVVQRLLGRLRAQGFVHHDLTRACVGQTEDSMRRVVLLGRISLYGSGASRLHDDIIAVTARWIDPVARKAPLTPYAEGTDKDAMRALEKAFEAARGRRVPQGVESKLQSVAPQDVAELLPHLQQRAATVADAAKALLAARGKQEADAMRAILADQRKRILAMQDQLQIPLLEEERRQQEDERKSWVKRLIAIDREVIEEPARILRSYEVQAPRVEPIGLVYLWPVSG